MKCLMACVCPRMLVCGSSVSGSLAAMFSTFFFWASAGGGPTIASRVKAARTAKRTSENRGRRWFDMGCPLSREQGARAENDGGSGRVEGLRRAGGDRVWREGWGASAGGRADSPRGGRRREGPGVQSGVRIVDPGAASKGVGERHWGDLRWANAYRITQPPRDRK